MNPLSYLKLGGSLLGLLALASAAWLIQDRFHQKALADNAAACALAAADTEDAAPLAGCLPGVASEVRAARQGRICEQTLLPSLRPETRFLMSQACGAGVKRLVATGDAASAERDSLQAQLSEARKDLKSTVERAERRTAKQTERTTHAQKVIQAAPRDAAGSLRCDAECLRRLNH